mgnify:CR=1 FL=1
MEFQHVSCGYFYTFAIHIAHKCPVVLLMRLFTLKYYTMLKRKRFRTAEKPKGISEKTD